VKEQHDERILGGGNFATCAGSFCCCMKGKKCDVSRPP